MRKKHSWLLRKLGKGYLGNEFDYEVEVPVGTIIEEEKPGEFASMDKKGVMIHFSPDEGQQLTTMEREILLAVQPENRWPVLNDKSWMAEGLYEIKEGSEVRLLQWKGDDRAMVKFKGAIPEQGPGVYFGIEMLASSVLANTDGSIRDRELFKCAPDRGLFVNINQIRLTRGHPPKKPERRASKGKLRLKERKEEAPNTTGIAATAVSSKTKHDPEYGKNDRVAWLTSDGNKLLGILKGVIPNETNELFAVIECDRLVTLGRSEKQMLVPLNHVTRLAPLTNKSSQSRISPDHKPDWDQKHSEQQRDPPSSVDARSSRDRFFSDPQVKQMHAASTIQKDQVSSFDEIDRDFQNLYFDNQAARPGTRNVPQIKDGRTCDTRVTNNELKVPHEASGRISNGTKSKNDGEMKTSASLDRIRNAHSGNTSINPLYEMGNAKGSRSMDDVKDERKHELEEGMLVEATVSGVPRYGVIRWIGTLPDIPNDSLIAGLEMEQEGETFGDGWIREIKYFDCPPYKALFLPLAHCKKDTRFQDSQTPRRPSQAFGDVDCPVVEGSVPPLEPVDLERLCGKNKGIQGHQNSCYLDATLFSMFTFSCVFDSILFRPCDKRDISVYREIQSILRDEIVNPLRTHMYVKADKVMRLRRLLDDVGNVTGLTDEEKDPEEFLQCLLSHTLRAEPLLKISTGQESFLYQLFVEKDDNLSFPTVQQLFYQSYLQADIKLKEIPSCLIIQMPRFGRQYKMYSRIHPTPKLDITDVLENSPRTCIVCGHLAEIECKHCFRPLEGGLEATSYCKNCSYTTHSHSKRQHHRPRLLSVPQECVDRWRHLRKPQDIPRVLMELFAVVCIETSHYVAFVKTRSGSDAPWAFFDSMADRKGGQHGYNIPEVLSCPQVAKCLSSEGQESMRSIKDDKQLPEHARRLMCDAYLCMYQSEQIMMYK